MLIFCKWLIVKISGIHQAEANNGINALLAAVVGAGIAKKRGTELAPYVNIVQTLLEHNIDVNAQDNLGCAAIIYASGQYAA